MSKLCVFGQMVYDVNNDVTSESYGLAWQTKIVPEPSTLLLIILGSAVLIRRSRRSVVPNTPSATRQETD
jgi:hypothetical protein